MNWKHLKSDANGDPSLSSLINALSKYQKKYGDMPVTFFSEEWTEDLESMEPQKRDFFEIRKVGSTLRISLFH